MSNIVYIATSIDGYIARQDGSIDWLTEIPNPTNNDYGFSDFIKRIDGVIMGRKTFQSVLEFDPWPYPKPVFVLSKTLTKVPEKLSEKAEVIHGDLQVIIDSLKARGINNLYVDGGKTIQSFLKKDLIDELIITRIPIVLGSGIPLFEDGGIELKFQHKQTESYDNGLVKSAYVRLR